MDTASLLPQVEDLEANIDELEDALNPLLRAPLSQTASTLPLLDKAKLYVLNAYAIESLLFSSLQASGVKAKEHPVFAELARLKAYFKKIKDAELGPEPKTRIDKGAAARFIKHGLAGNDRYDRERRERMGREKESYAKPTHTKFEEDGSTTQITNTPLKRSVDDAQMLDAGEGVQETELDSEDRELYGAAKKTATTEPPTKKARVSESGPTGGESPTATTPASASKDEHKSKRREEKEARRLRKEANQKDRREHKEKKRSARMAAAEEKEPEIVLPERQAPRTQSETFKALLDGPLKKGKGKSKGK